MFAANASRASGIFWVRSMDGVNWSSLKLLKKITPEKHRVDTHPFEILRNGIVLCHMHKQNSYRITNVHADVKGIRELKDCSIDCFSKLLAKKKW